VLRWIKQLLRGQQSASGSVGQAMRAALFGDDSDAATSAELLEQKQREADERSAESERRALSAKRISEAVQREGIWFPPSHRGQNDDGRFR
jgi:hypothetical protein